MKSLFATAVAGCLLFGCLLCQAVAQPPNRPEQRLGGEGRGEQGRGRGGDGQRGQGRPGMNQPRGGQRGGPAMTPPWLRIFDINGDEELSSEEISQATASLLKMDKNGDGKLSLDELRPEGGAGAEGGSRSQGGSGMQGGRGMQGGPGLRDGSGSRGASNARGASGARGGPGGNTGQERAGRPGGNAGRGGQSRPGGGRGQARNSPQADEAFAKELLAFDENGDKQLTKREIPGHMHAAFDIADANRNGSLDEAETVVLASQFRRNQLNPDAANAQPKNAPTRGGRPQ